VTDAAERLRECPYQPYGGACRGLWGHVGPHLFEQHDIERARAAGAAAAVERLRPIFAAKRDQMIQDGKDGLADMVTATVVSVAWDDAIAILDAPQEEES